MKTIKLISGGEFIPLDLTPFKDLQYRTDPALLPDLPAGVTVDDLYQTWQDEASDPHDRLTIWSEIQVRTWGYLPIYGTDARDQWGYDFNGFDQDGRDRQGFTPEERTADPMLADRPERPNYAMHGDVDARVHNAGVVGNPGNKGGRTVYAADGSQRTLDQCWFDVFYANERLPVHDRLTDEQIVEHICLLFPKRQTKQMLKVKDMRWRFNTGRLACQQGKAPLPGEGSHTYVRTETRVIKTTPRGKAVHEWDIRQILLSQQHRA